MYVENKTIANKCCQHILTCTYIHTYGSMPGGGEEGGNTRILRTFFDNNKKEKIRASSYLSYCILVLCFLYIF